MIQQPTRFDMTGRIIAVTGAATGTGRAVAEAFKDAGGAVFLLDVDEVTGRLAAEGVGTFLAADVTSSESVAAALSVIGRQHGRLDVLVNNAGGFGSTAKTETLATEEWSRILDLNLTSVFLVCRAALPLLRGSDAGRIVNVGSLAGLTAGYTTSPAYAAAKAGVHAFTRVLAHEVAPEGITVNAIAPSAILTDRIRRLRSETELESTARSIPIGRYQTPAEFAPWVVFLASGEAAFMTGQTVSVNGGRLMV